MFTATGGGNPPVNVVPPALDNLSPNVGDTITCSQGTWTGATSYAYQWVQYPNTFILGQTTNQYVVQAGDVGFKFFCQVQAINAVGNTIVDSDITNLVAGGDPLAGITFAVRLQSYQGFGATPSAPFSLYQDIFNASPATAANDPVASWEDALGTSGLSASQASAGSQPKLSFVGSGSDRPIVEFDGVDDLMNFLFLLAIPLPFTVYTLIRWMRVSNFNAAISDPSGGNAFGIHQGVSGVYMFNGGATPIDPSPDTNWKVVTARWMDPLTSSLLNVNSGSDLTGNPGTNRTALTGLNLGNNGQGGDYAQIQVAAILIEANEGLNRSAIEVYLSSPAMFPS